MRNKGEYEMPKYKEMYEWEKASHYATQKELERIRKMYTELAESILKRLEDKENE